MFYIALSLSYNLHQKDRRERKPFQLEIMFILCILHVLQYVYVPYPDHCGT